jgi:hypothetical protein
LRYTGRRMRRWVLTALAMIPLLLPAATHAMEIETLEFAKGQINATWTGKGDIAMEQRDDGVVLHTGNGTGYFLTQNTAFFPEGVTVTATVDVPTQIGFAWILSNESLNQSFELPMFIPAGNAEQVSLSMASAEQLSGAKRQIGIMVPPNTALLLHRIELYRWNLAEEFMEMVQSFWTFDALRPYSINFVWGPQIAFNTIQRTQLYETLPPASFSGTFAVFAVLLVILIIFFELPFVFGVKQHKIRWIVTRFGIVLLAAWIAFDVRMGSEFLSWVLHDHQTYVAADETTREFRERNRFYDFAETAALYVNDRQSYIFFAEQPWPYLGNMRYISYPSIPGIDVQHDDTWVIYRRPDMAVNANGQLMNEGEAITSPGKILEQFDETSFIFRTNVPPNQ